jgi:hypothetical protein
MEAWLAAIPDAADALRAAIAAFVGSPADSAAAVRRRAQELGTTAALLPAAVAAAALAPALERLGSAYSRPYAPLGSAEAALLLLRECVRRSPAAGVLAAEQLRGGDEIAAYMLSRAADPGTDADAVLLAIAGLRAFGWLLRTVPLPAATVAAARLPTDAGALGVAAARTAAAAGRAATGMAALYVSVRCGMAGDAPGTLAVRTLAADIPRPAVPPHERYGPTISGVAGSDVWS